MPSIRSIQIGHIAPLGPRRVPSGFVKTPVTGPVAITATGVAADQQADLSVHGDAAKAVYAYAAASYDIWRQTHAQHDWPFGALAENLTIDGMAEEDVCIGDIHRAGSAVLQVTQPRQPCYKFALRFGDPALPMAMVRNGRCGWYYRVIEAGEAAAGVPVTLIDRLNPTWPISRMHQFIHRQERKPHDAAELAALPGIAENWPARLRKTTLGH